MSVHTLQKNSSDLLTHLPLYMVSIFGQSGAKKVLEGFLILIKGAFFFKPPEPWYEAKFENPAKAIHDVSVPMSRRKMHACNLIIIFSFFPPLLALKVLKKTIKGQVSVQGRIYWHLLLIYGPSLCSLSGLCQSFFLLYISWGAPHAATERQSPSVYKLFVR